MNISEYSQTFTNIHEYSWTLMNIHKHSRILFMNIDEYSWIFMNISEYSQTFTNIHEYSWTFLNIHKHSRIFMNIHEYSWIFMFTEIHFIVIVHVYCMLSTSFLINIVIFVKVLFHSTVMYHISFWMQSALNLYEFSDNIFPLFLEKLENKSRQDYV